MPRRSPTKHIDEIGPLDLSHKKVLNEYISSVLQNETFIKPPSWTAKRDAIELLAIENDRELQASVRQQVLLREQASRQRAINSHRIENLYKLQTELQQRFIEANRFIKDCDDKKKQAQQTVSIEKASHEELKIFIRETKQKVDSLLQFRGRLLKTVKDLEPYETILHEAINKFKIWNSIQDCTARSDALMMTQVEINKDKDKAMERIEAMRLKFLRKSQEAAAMALAFDTSLSGLERECLNIKFEIQKWEDNLVKVKKELISQETRITSMIDNIFCMYTMLCKRKGIQRKIGKYAIERQMEFIRNEIKIMKGVAQICLNEEDI